MLKVLLWEMYSLTPETVPLPIDCAAESVDADAILMIGDRAMHPERGVYREIWDLGDRWCRWTELPFVFAMWVVRNSSALPDAWGAMGLERLANILETCRDDGLANLEAIAQRESAAHGLTKEDLHRYFAENLHFRLGPGERAGLEAFRQKAMNLGLVPEQASLVT
jgi:chorismate dehydratase